MVQLLYPRLQQSNHGIELLDLSNTHLDNSCLAILKDLVSFEIDIDVRNNQITRAGLDTFLRARYRNWWQCKPACGIYWRGNPIGSFTMYEHWLLFLFPTRDDTVDKQE